MSLWTGPSYSMGGYSSLPCETVIWVAMRSLSQTVNPQDCLSPSSLSFSLMRFHSSQYSRCFIPVKTKLWNELPSMIVEAAELQNLKLGANAFLLGVEGL